MTAVVPIIPVGPGDLEHRRLLRLVRSVVRYEPDMRQYVLVHDGADEAKLRTDLPPLGPESILVKNPRRGRCLPGNDGLACGLTAGYAVIAERWPGSHAWKLDTDAYVIGPCRRRIADYFAAHPNTGMAGTLDRDPDGTSRQRDFARLADGHVKGLRPLWYWRATGRFTTRFLGPGRRMATLYQALDAAGVVRGRYVQGGSYALAAATLTAWRADGRLNDPFVWLGSWVPEDWAFSMWTQTAGFSLGNFNAPGEVFAVKNHGMPLPPDDCVARSYGVVHSVKAATWDEEQAIVAKLDDGVGPLSSERSRKSKQSKDQRFEDE